MVAQGRIQGCVVSRGCVHFTGERACSRAYTGGRACSGAYTGGRIQGGMLASIPNLSYLSC